MDDPTLQEQLRQLRHRHTLLHNWVGSPYLYVFADHVGFARAGVLDTSESMQGYIPAVTSLFP